MTAAFPVKLLRLVICPKDSGVLIPAQTMQSQYIETGVARCDKCGAGYEIRNGILRILPDQQPVDALTRDEQVERDLNAERYDTHFSDWANSVEFSRLFEERSSFSGKIILDLACGTGRVTTHLIRHAQGILASDLSEQSLAVLSRNVGARANIGLIWSDATQLRLLPGTVDFAISTQLLEHIPTAEKRAQFIERVHTALRPDGVFLLTVYYYSMLRRLLRRPQEGYHANGIFYHRFTIKEIGEGLSGLFQVREMCPIQVDPRLFRGSYRFSNRIARVLEQAFLPSLIGQLLFIKANKRH